MLRPCLPTLIVILLVVPAVRAQRAQAWGTLEGRVTFRGDLPVVKDLSDIINRHPDKDVFKKASADDKRDPTWRIDPKTRGVANVCVYLKRPANGVLPIHPDDKKRKGNIVIDTPLCCIVPHAVAVYPEWYDGKERGKTGQKLIVKNSSSVPHRLRLIGNPKYNPAYADNPIPLPRERVVEARPQPLPLSVQCSMHVWMTSHAWVFDHPYFALTKADGTFTMPRVPAGTEVHVMAWHEARGWLLTKNGKAMTLKAAQNTLDFQISAEPPK